MLAVQVVVAWGSSPLARGLRRAHSEDQVRIRIIPARAGFTRSRRTGPAASRDHPRSRGVYPGIPPSRSRVTGSSPLARGLPWKHEGDFSEGGIIPARAGFTSRGPVRLPSAADHPRSRGVYGRWCSCRVPSRGSSPLARGLPDDRLVGGHLPGIIPARAGFTSSTTWRCTRTWDHPRSRGVYGRRRHDTTLADGSSPLARGLRAPRSLSWPSSGIIPARAGFTC